MNKMWTIMRREYLSRVKTKGFVIGTILLPLLMVAIFAVPVFLLFLKSDETKRIAIIDQTGVVFDSLEAALNQPSPEGKRPYHFAKLTVRPDQLDSVKKALAAGIDRQEWEGYILIPDSVFEGGAARYFGKSVSNRMENEEIEEALSRAVTAQRIQRSGLDAEQIHRALAPVDLNVRPASQEKKNPGVTFMLAYFLGFFIYMAMFIYGAIVMRSVIEEKTSRVVESVVSSIKPFYLMAGKIFGVGAVGLTQFLIWAGVMGLLSLYGLAIAAAFVPDPAKLQNLTLPTIPAATLGFFVLFFLLGYLLYSTLYAGIGAMVNSEQEAQQLVLPIALIIIVPILLITYVITNPDTQMSVLMSLVPFFAPILMLARIAVATPPAWQIAASIVLMVLTIIGMIWIVGRIYRVGVLMYGKRPGLREIMKWIRYA